MHGLCRRWLGKISFRLLGIAFLVVTPMYLAYTGLLDGYLKYLTQGSIRKAVVSSFLRSGLEGNASTYTGFVGGLFRGVAWGGDNIVKNETTVHISSTPKSTTPLPGRPEYCDQCFHHDFKYLITPADICSMSSVGGKQQIIDLVIMITSIVRNRQQRDVIRQTWAGLSQNNTSNIRHLFLFGHPHNSHLQDELVKEAQAFGDILQEDYKEAYNNLTLKTISGFEWVSKHCGHVPLLMKTDDDMFVNPIRLLQVSKDPKFSDAVFGSCSQVANPIRDKRSKWYASPIDYPQKKYHGFCSGTGYALPVHLAAQVVAASKNVPFFHLEDVYVALCIHQLKKKLVAAKGFNSGRPTFLSGSSTCQVEKFKTTITSHGLSGSLLLKTWKACSPYLNVIPTTPSPP